MSEMVLGYYLPSAHVAHLGRVAPPRRRNTQNGLPCRALQDVGIERIVGREYEIHDDGEGTGILFVLGWL